MRLEAGGWGLRRAAPASRGVHISLASAMVNSPSEDRGREHSAGAAVANAFDEMIKRADTAGRDDGYRHAR